MADDVDEGVEHFPSSCVTERSCNLSKDLKEDILEAVSRFWHYFAQVQTNLEAKSAVNKDLEMEVKACKEEIQRLRTNASSHTRHVAPSLDTVRRETNCAGQVPTSVGKDRKLYSEAVQTEGRKEKRYKLMMTSRTDHSVEAIKNIIKTSVNPTSMKVGVCALKSLQDGRVLMEMKSKEKIELLYMNINGKCSQLLEVNIQKPRNPKLVVYNIPEEITLESAEETITTQNPKLILNAGDIKPKFIYRGKRNTKNLVI